MRLFSKNVIIARITLQKKLHLNNELINLKNHLKVIFDRVDPYCSEFLIDYDKDINNLNLNAGIEKRKNVSRVTRQIVTSYSRV